MTVVLLLIEQSSVLLPEKQLMMNPTSGLRKVISENLYTHVGTSDIVLKVSRTNSIFKYILTAHRYV